MHSSASLHRIKKYFSPPYLSCCCCCFFFFFFLFQPIFFSLFVIFLLCSAQNPFSHNHAARLKIWLWVRDCCGVGGWMEFLWWLGWCSCGDLGLDFLFFLFLILIFLLCPLSLFLLSLLNFFFIGCFGFSGCGFARRGLGFAR